MSVSYSFVVLYNNLTGTNYVVQITLYKYVELLVLFFFCYCQILVLDWRIGGIPPVPAVRIPGT